MISNSEKKMLCPIKRHMSKYQVPKVISLGAPKIMKNLKNAEILLNYHFFYFLLLTIIDNIYNF